MDMWKILKYKRNKQANFEIYHIPTLASYDTERFLKKKFGLIKKRGQEVDF